MKIRILKQTMLGATVVKVGDVVEAPLPDAQFLIGIAKAEQYVETSSIREESIAEPEVLSCPPVKPSSKRRKTNVAKPGL
jgi:hypothetical protein